jgi:hypothetical protein
VKKSLLTFIITVSAGCLFAEAHPVLSFRLDDGEGTTIRNSGNAAVTGKIINQDFKWGEGRTGEKALYFTNPFKCRSGRNGCAIVDTANIVDFTKPFTICLWVKPDVGLMENSQYAIIGNVKGDYGPGWRLLFGWGALRFRAGGGTKETQSGLGIPQSRFPHKKGVWSHIAITYDGKNVALYLNGIAAGKKEMILEPGDKTMSIGAYSQGYAYGFCGAIAEVKIYDVILTPEQILKEAQCIEG